MNKKGALGNILAATISAAGVVVIVGLVVMADDSLRNEIKRQACRALDVSRDALGKAEEALQMVSSFTKSSAKKDDRESVDPWASADSALIQVTDEGE